MPSCYICKRDKHESYFYSDKSKSSGRASRCKLCHNQWKNHWLKTTPNGRWLALRLSARERGHDLTLSKDQFLNLIAYPCQYCGRTGRVGIDRVDSKQGYTPTNTVPCCTVCNRMKLDHSVDDFLKHTALIVRKNEEPAMYLITADNRFVTKISNQTLSTQDQDGTRGQSLTVVCQSSDLPTDGEIIIHDSVTRLSRRYNAGLLHSEPHVDGTKAIYAVVELPM